MAGRPPLPIGSHGDIYTTALRPGTFQAETRFRDTDGVTRKVRAGGSTEAKAKAALREKILDRKRAGNAEELSVESPLSALVEKWLATLEPKRRSVTGTRSGSLADDTVDIYIDVAKKVVIPGIGAVRLREMNTQRADGYLSEVTARKRHVRTVLMQACGLGVRWGLMEYNPVRETETPPRSPSDKRTLTPEDVRELMARTQAWQARKPGKGGPQRGVDMVEIVALLMATGERIGEILAVEWPDIEHLDDLTQPAAVTITGTIDKKGQRQPLPKSEHGYRRLLLPEYGRQALLAQRERGLPFTLVFPSRNGTARWKNNVNRSWREIRGDDYSWVTPRTFRKTAGTAIEREFGAEAAAAQLGHSSPDITRKHYIDRAIAAPDNRAALDAFNPFAPNKRPSRPDLKVVGGE
ncbi:tyrosine-type recombinase/integrase [Mycobacteroides abscessus]|uniref:tyrosine-type recombinase/integrase n=1 Tax=Mycobacteroides abscessus TaxID=36809 RepID=UPI0009273944|nr:site-specific integrase [Mycobacteroides abscessus]SIJ35106.1 putative phage integrase [Mycobacteroides abscessus subsp. abscessus]SIK91374.1 putative phage integrase [Mycobacteroides abscessus subsp. abscessus]SIL99084.1 putative phage integrase [Mycobacteroides abscessus subsp. abscessus]SLE80930.1 putative phage integrase [Mycobacteroides abscessus subsp. abscessus]